MKNAHAMLAPALALGLSLTAFAAAQAQQVPGLHFVENWDQDGDGAVSLAEMETKRGDIFTAFDANEDGYLDAEEYVAFDAARAADMADMPAGGRRLVERVEGGMALAVNDSDGDGRVSRDEFLGAVPDWMQMMDKTGDGVVTTADFGRP